jgi:hypothetical protein
LAVSKESMVKAGKTLSGLADGALEANRRVIAPLRARVN